MAFLEPLEAIKLNSDARSKEKLFCSKYITSERAKLLITFLLYQYMKVANYHSLHCGKFGGNPGQPWLSWS